jgi:hypothetical protein
MVYTPTAITNTFVAGTVANPTNVNQNFTDCSTNFSAIQTAFTGTCPLGGILGWLKTLSGCPSLPTDFVECNGQTLSDAGSPFNGQVIPNLNASGGGNPCFLRGATLSGGTGGGETHTHGNGTLSVGQAEHGSIQVASGGTWVPSTAHYHYLSGSVASGSSLPTYYSVVWIMRIK